MSFGAVLSIRHIQRILSHYGLKLLTKKKPTQSNTLWKLEICLKLVVGNSRVIETKNKENVASIKNFSKSICRRQVLADKTNSVALLELTQLKNISITTTTRNILQ